MTKKKAMSKYCPRCKKEKALLAFYRNRSTKDGRSDYCRKCFYKYQKEWEARNPEKAKKGKEYVRNYNRKHKQTSKFRKYAKGYGREYRQTPEAKAREQKRRESPKRKQYLKKYFEGRAQIYNNRRRARKMKATGSHTFGEWELLKKQYGYTCPACERSEPQIVLTEDHIVPLSKGGSNFIENIQPLCRSCNSAKHTKTEKYERRTKES